MDCVLKQLNCFLPESQLSLKYVHFPMRSTEPFRTLTYLIQNHFKYPDEETAFKHSKATISEITTEAQTQKGTTYSEQKDEF